MLKETVKFLTLAVVFLCAVKMSTQCTPSGDPLTVEDLVQRAPIVVRGYLVRKIGDTGPNAVYRACLLISHVYKGRVPSNFICPDRFGPEHLCLIDLKFGVEYLIFLNKTPTGFEARYDFVHSAAVPVNDDVLRQLNDGICCPEELGECEQGNIRCVGNNPQHCSCDRLPGRS